jgi:signal transduction histidine kinase/CheY-like chemotaxis protein
LDKTKIIASSIDISDVKSLSATTNDIRNPHYLYLIANLNRIISVDDNYKNIYIFKLAANGDVVFALDIEKHQDREIERNCRECVLDCDIEQDTCLVAISLDLGSTYPHATEKLIASFSNQIAFVEGPEKDQYGTWVSGLVPIIDPDTGKTIAVLGLDYDATSWSQILLSRLILPIIMMILIYFLIIFGHHIAKSRKSIIHRALRINKQKDMLSKFTLNNQVSLATFEQNIDFLTKILGETLNADETSMWFISDDKNSFDCISIHSTFDSPKSRQHSLPIEAYSEFFEFLNKVNVTAINNITTEPLLIKFYKERIIGCLPKSVIIANIRTNQKIVGSIAIERYNNMGQWHSDEESFVETISALISQVITKRDKEKAELELREAKNRFENTLESMTEGFIYLSKEKEIKYINHNAFSIFNLEYNHKNYDHIWRDIPIEIKNVLQNLLKIAIEKRSDLNKLEYLESIDKWLEFRLYPTKDDISVFFVDATKKRQSENALLENQRLTAIGEITNAFSHDFNNYLQVILANVEILKVKLENRPDLADYIRTVLMTSNDATTRIQLLQRFSGSKNKASDYDRVEINKIVADAVQQSIPIWKTEPEKNGKHIKIVEKYNEIKEVFGNEHELRSVLYNLLKNSVEAMPSGGEITIETGINEDGVFIRFSDNGEGMSAENSKRIFEPFFTTRGFEAGKGLGMTGVHNIINEHNGKIHVLHSLPGRGTTIEVILPIHESTEKVTSPTQTTARREKPRIIWVDDDIMIREIGYEMLDIMGYEITVADGGAVALEHLENEEFDIILSDIGMPGMSGWQFMAKVHELYPFKYKRVLISGWGDQITEEEKIENHIDYVMGKPVKMPQMKKLLDTLWS